MIIIAQFLMTIYRVIRMKTAKICGNNLTDLIVTGLSRFVLMKKKILSTSILICRTMYTCANSASIVHDGFSWRE
jgi:hypothetical protein